VKIHSSKRDSDEPYEADPIFSSINRQREKCRVDRGPKENLGVTQNHHQGNAAKKKKARKEIENSIAVIMRLEH
jgi:hypothetical protein